ncbi:MAG: helix-turn-helix transcriptional regulator [Mycoplasmataceae bacterium]|jgi:transcriptional regulator with XRE-family HTH domain|nr:helix-turn-helix transcriptional regulator [Mycoplasmataceae bacterium]
MKNNSFAILLRGIRKENNEVLYNMAKRMNISVSYLSSIEIGERKIPKNFIAKLVKIYNLPEEKKLELIKSADEDLTRKVVLDLSKTTPLAKRVGIIFARKFPTIKNSALEEITKILDKEK